MDKNSTLLKSVRQKTILSVFILEMIIFAYLFVYVIKIHSVTFAQYGTNNEDFIYQNAVTCTVPPFIKRLDCARELGKKIAYLFPLPLDQAKQCIKLHHPILIKYCQGELQKSTSTPSAT